MNYLLYELKPYACAVIGLGGMFVPNTLGLLSGFVLTLLGASIWKMRHEFRHGNL